MDKKIAGLLGAVASLAALNTAQAAPSTSDPTDVLKAQSFSDLLEPIPNALDKLQAVDEAGSVPKVQLAQFFVEHHHHHHHHHHHGYYRGYGPRIVVPGYRYGYGHHHHHHHHHHSYYRRYREY